MKHNTIKAFAEFYKLKYDTVKKWKQRKHIILEKNGKLDDQNPTNAAFLATKGIYTRPKVEPPTQSTEAMSPLEKPENSPLNIQASKTLAGYSAELDELLAMPLEELNKMLLASKVSEVQTKIERLVHKIAVDKKQFIERARAKEILLSGLKEIVIPLVNFGANPLAERLSEIYLQKIPKQEQKQKVSELMSDYAKGFEETLIRCERELEKA